MNLPTDPATLSAEHVDATPVPRDWSAEYERDPDAWTAYEAGDYEHETDDGEDCTGPVVGSWYSAECQTCGAVLDDVETFEGPVMSYAYPYGGDTDHETVAKLAGLPLCIVEDETGETWLALTGGGMDLSWEIAEAYIVLGHLPPVHFRPPAMAGRGTSERDRRIVAAYLRSCQVVEMRARRDADDVRRMVERAEDRVVERWANVADDVMADHARRAGVDVAGPGIVGAPVRIVGAERRRVALALDAAHVHPDRA